MVASSNRAPLRIVISTRGGVVTGKVTTPGEAPRPGRAFVLLAPAGRNAQAPDPEAVQYADDTGRFEFSGIRPGRYRIYAFEEMDPQALADPGFLQPFEQGSEPFEVSEGGRVSKQVPLIPANTAPPVRK